MPNSCFWRCQARPVPLTEQPRVQACLLTDLQRTCSNPDYTVKSDPIPPEGGTQPITVDLEAINRNEEKLVVRGGYNVDLLAMETSGLPRAAQNDP